MISGQNDKIEEIKNKLLQKNDTGSQRTKKVALFHDLSGFGRCALTVAVPVTAALRLQPVPIPTALLSTHTGGFENYSYLDLTRQVNEFTEHYTNLGVRFDFIYTGFLGGEAQFETIKNFVSGQRKLGAYIIVDPVMADDGKVYSTYTEKMCAAMRDLAKNADLITPNITEAYILCGDDYTAPPYNEEYLKKLALRLMEKRYGSAIVTGIEFTDGKIGAMYVNKMNNFYFEVTYFKSEKHNTNYPGSGDLFTSIICGLSGNGADLKKSIQFAVDFTQKVVGYTEKLASPVREGLIFEPFLRDLTAYYI